MIELVVDVMDLVAHSAGGEGGKGWRDFFKGAMKVKEEKAISDTSSTFSRELPPQRKPIRAKYIVDTAASSDVFSLSLDERASLPLPQKFHHVPEAGGPTGNNNALEFDFKVTDQHGNMHKLRFHADCVDTVRNEVAKKLELDLNEFLFKYIDDENDEVVLSSDNFLKDAIESARLTGSYAVKLMAKDNVKKVEKKDTDPATNDASAAGGASATQSAASQAPINNTTLMLGIGGAVFATTVVIIAAFVLTRKR